MLQVKRVYEPPARSDGTRILVDRLWPRGLSKERASVDLWMKELAPSAALRRWFAHDPAKWAEFRRRYRHELRQARDAIQQLATRASRRRVTLVFGARDARHNDAIVLAAVIRGRMTADRARHGASSHPRKRAS